MNNVFLGYSNSYKWVVCYNPKTDKILNSINVFHDESVFPLVNSSPFDPDCSSEILPNLNSTRTLVISSVLENVSRDCTPTHSTTSTSGYSTTQLFVPVEVQLENGVILYGVFGLEESIAGSVPPSASSKYSNNNNSGSTKMFIQWLQRANLKLLRRYLKT